MLFFSFLSFSGAAADSPRAVRRAADSPRAVRQAADRGNKPVILDQTGLRWPRPLWILRDSLRL